MCKKWVSPKVKMITTIIEDSDDEEKADDFDVDINFHAADA